MKRLVLASKSPYRRKILEDLGVPFEAESPEFDEDHASFSDPEAMVTTFARGKARSLRERFPDAWIIGGDQTAELDGRSLQKPGTRERAVDQLVALSGRTHRLLTALALCDARTGRCEHRLLIHRMTMRQLERDEIEAYVGADLPLDCAGAYRIEARGILLFSEMQGLDHSAIVGLPLTALDDLLRSFGGSLLAAALGRNRAPGK